MPNPRTPQDREAFESEKPFSVKVVIECKKNRGQDLPCEFCTETVEYPYLTSEEMHLVERTVCESLLALGLNPTVSSK